jgi:hypothetical protein
MKNILQAYRSSYLWFSPPLILGGSVISTGTIHDLRWVKVPGTLKYRPTLKPLDCQISPWWQILQYHTGSAYINSQICNIRVDWIILPDLPLAASDCQISPWWQILQYHTGSTYINSQICNIRVDWIIFFLCFLYRNMVLLKRKKSWQNEKSEIW